MVSAPLSADVLSPDRRWLCRENAASPELCQQLSELVSKEDVAWRDVEDSEVALEVWKAVQFLVPEKFEGCRLAGPHPSLRLLQYHGDCAAGGDHPAHADTPLAGPGSYSRLTVLLYVNSDHTGGNLRFLEGGVDVEPRQGTVVVFDHRLLHQAGAVLFGTKQVVKMSVLYEAEPEMHPRPTPASADLQVRLPFALLSRALARGAEVASPALCQFVARPALLKRALGFVGTLRQELLRLSAAAGRKPGNVAVVEELLDFILAYDTEELQDILSSSAFIPMSIALSHPGLKLKAYRAWQAARALHNDEKCVLLGETMLKDTTHQNPEVRLACVETYFLLMPNEELRSGAIKQVLDNEDDPAVRHRAVQGIAHLVRGVAGTEAPVERLTELWDSYVEPLRKVAASCSPCSPEVPLAVRALADLAAMRQQIPLE